jgi:hypothetical protein
MAPHSSADAIIELAEILATGLMRLQARKSSEVCSDSGESSLHISAGKSGHPNSTKGENGG